MNRETECAGAIDIVGGFKTWVKYVGGAVVAMNLPKLGIDLNHGESIGKDINLLARSASCFIILHSLASVAEGSILREQEQLENAPDLAE
ncbi:MAG: hypothetical protein JWO35_436 [Candidatus Saccharibacteria bacterium]|nr:hypothetical protein [Candidatus Saccharibacteria bacterium]